MLRISYKLPKLLLSYAPVVILADPLPFGRLETDQALIPVHTR